MFDILEDVFSINPIWKYILRILGIIFLVIAIQSAVGDIRNYTDGDAAKIVELHIEQSDDPYAIEAREGFGFGLYVSDNSMFINSLAKFPDGTPISKAMTDSMLKGAFQLYTIDAESILPDEVGVPKSLVTSGISSFKSGLKIKSNEKKFGKIRLKKGETSTLDVFFKKEKVNDSGTCISCSYDSQILKLIGNNTFEAISDGETEIGILYYNGQETFIEKIKVIVKK
ncbi:hypothetical protein [Tepidibacter hydrothermalis]|uniref:Uncharacterized protein n=1 Tax=Tepidibacter hydrothermalis TaxID=3036126 RepID=A0ABY8EG73_9FIRM|nr:hypothetical protein [Tepidibacter hydrothermalis]WFD09748.1 hypothetical protein P4S50_15325 [Tepidibacter hydrothermalis]